MKVIHVAAAAAVLVGVAIVGDWVLKPSQPPPREVVIEAGGGLSIPKTLQPEAKASDATLAALADLERRDRRWSDAVSLAGASSRIQLAPVVQDLQEQAREYEALELPSCLAAAKPYIVESRTATLKGVMAFMSDSTYGKYVYIDEAERAERADRNVRMVLDGCRN